MLGTAARRLRRAGGGCRRDRISIALALGTANPTATAAAGPVVMAQSVGPMGTTLVAASNGHTVYAFDSDSPGVSNCTGGCAATWRPLTVST